MGEEILTKITDGGKYGEGEKELSRLLRQACDDRCDVRIDGRHISITDPAESVLKKGLPKFWGSLSSKPKVDLTALEDGVDMVQKNKFAP